MEKMKFLAFSDLHGNLKSLERFQRRTRKFEFDLAVCAGDLTNYYLNPKEIDKLPFYEEFVYNLKVPFLMVWGNRDFERFSNKKFPLELAVHLDEKDYVFKEKWHFTSHIENITSNSILISHNKIEVKNGKNPLIQLWGDSHIPKILYRTHLCIDLGFLYRDEIHGSLAMDGLFWIIDINTDKKLSFKWFTLDKTNSSYTHFFVKKGKNYLDEFIFPWYLKDKKNYINKIIEESK